MTIMTPEQREARREYLRAWKAKPENRQKVLIANRLWYARNKEKQAIYRQRPEVKARARQHGRRHYENISEMERKRKAFHSAKQRARITGIEFTIKFEEIEWPEICPVFGFALNYRKPQNGRLSYDSPSLDRTNSELGYVPGNVAVMSWRANMLKRDASPEEMCLLALYFRRMRSH